MDKEYIGREKALEELRKAPFDSNEREWALMVADLAIRETQTEDVMPVVRCKDCEQCYSEIAAHSGKRVHYCKMLRETFGQDAEVREDFFCQNGKRKEKRSLKREEREKVYVKAYAKWGSLQLTVAIEEMQELGKEICKEIRGKGSMKCLAEEIADVRIMLEQLEMIYRIKNLVPELMDQKVRRLEERLEKENG